MIRSQVPEQTSSVSEGIRQSQSQILRDEKFLEFVHEFHKFIEDFLRDSRPVQNVQPSTSYYQQAPMLQQANFYQQSGLQQSLQQVSDLIM